MIQQKCCTGQKQERCGQSQERRGKGKRFKTQKQNLDVLRIIKQIKQI